MRKFRSTLPIVFLLLVVTVTVVLGQRRWRQSFDDREGVPVWSNEPGFEKDVFTFVRIQYDSGYWRGRGGGWRVDYRDADLNFSYRLQQLTSLKVDPEGKVLRLTDPELFNYPFIYMVEPGALEFSEAEVKELRRYLLSGGFLMVDDFWGEREYQNFYEQIKRVFPEFEPQELPLEHPVFNCVFQLKEKPQIPNFQLGEESQYTGITWERPDAREPRYLGIHDPKGRMMVIICHNTDLADGWEREGVYEYYFREFSEKKAYPLGINIVFYAMTH
ncbi:MAG: DUF4159 domain-containing protein [Verrucomicrobia bacterium]|nr:DUF4159 domain-containing protein [Verrucomicrobiota bacterium]